MSLLRLVRYFNFEIKGVFHIALQSTNQILANLPQRN